MEKKDDKILLKFKLTILKKDRYLTFDLIPTEQYVENDDDKEDYEYTEEEKDQIIADLKKDIEEQNAEIAKIEQDISEAEKNKKDLELQITELKRN